MRNSGFVNITGISNIIKDAFLQSKFPDHGKVEYIPGGSLKNIGYEGWGFWADGEIVYGIPGKAISKKLYGDQKCDSATFGGDPAPGVAKMCYAFTPTPIDAATPFTPGVTPAANAVASETLAIGKPDLSGNTTVSASVSSSSPLMMVGIGVGALAAIGLVIYLVRK